MSEARGASIRFAVLGVLCALAGVLLVLGFAPRALAAGDANSNACLSETEASPGFTTYLPDCRADELVSPAFGGGLPPLGPQLGSRPPSISPDGEHILGHSFGGFAETGNLEENGFEFGALYEFSRAAGGWTAEALDPPASEYPRREFVLASADLSRSLWELAAPAHSGEEIGVLENGYDGWTLAVREQAGAGKGRFVTVGPLVAPGHHGPGAAELPAASSDLGHILVSLTNEDGELWPGDETAAGGRSLYEYDRDAGGEPALVGVRNSGRLNGSPHINEGAELVSRCGTRLGSAGTASVYNAMSADGETVYFTALECPGGPAKNELYARVGAAKTLDLSEPPLAGPESIPGRECTGACETDETSSTSHQPAVFQGASSDGTKVFFTSEQPLLNAAIGAGNGLYEETIDGTGAAAHATSLTLIAGHVPGVARISETGTRIYYESTEALAPGGEAEGLNLYGYDTETSHTAFVTTLMTHAEVQVLELEGVESAQLKRDIEQRTGVSVLDQGYAPGLGRPFDTTRDGQFLVFASARDLTGPEDSSSVSQLFEYNAETEMLTRASAGQKNPGASFECPATKTVEAGYDCNGNTKDPEDTPLMVPPPSFAAHSEPASATSNLSVTEDGSVVFASPLTLTPQATPSRVIAESEGVILARTENIYEYRSGNVYLVSPADEAAPLKLPVHQDGLSRLYGIDPSGRDLFFETTDSLVPQDTDTQSSWYDAREDGGFPAPTLSPECDGEACQGAPPATPVFAVPGSNAQAGSGNLAGGGELNPPKPAVKSAAKSKAKLCKKGFVRKKAKCVKAPKRTKKSAKGRK
jgi:hypothetical protein